MEISKQEIEQIFKCPLLLGIDRDNALRIFDGGGCRIQAFVDQEIILSPETHKPQVGLLLSGKAVITTPDPGKNTLLRFLGAGDPFGIANLFTNQPFISVIRAHGSCKALFIPETAVRALLESDSVFLYHYLGFLSDRIRFLNKKIGYLTAGSAERRLALYLYAHKTRDLSLSVSLTSLSELLDIGRASLYRAFDKLTEDGFIQKEGRRILLLDPEAMLQAYQ